MSYEADPHNMVHRVEALMRDLDDAKRRVTRLRKAVNWLRGANHDAHKRFNFGTKLWETPDECMVWECQRAREILAEDVTSDPK